MSCYITIRTWLRAWRSCYSWCLPLFWSCRRLRRSSWTV